MTFQKKLLALFKEGYHIKCDRGSDVYRVMYILTACKCKPVKGLSSIDARAEMLSLVEAHGVVHIMRQNGTENIITWDSKFTGTRRISVSEIDQYLNPNYR